MWCTSIGDSIERSRLGKWGSCDPANPDPISDSREFEGWQPVDGGRYQNNMYCGGPEFWNRKNRIRRDGNQVPYSRRGLPSPSVPRCFKSAQAIKDDLRHRLAHKDDRGNRLSECTFKENLGLQSLLRTFHKVHRGPDHFVDILEFKLALRNFAVEATDEAAIELFNEFCRDYKTVNYVEFCHKLANPSESNNTFELFKNKLRQAHLRSPAKLQSLCKPYLTYGLINIFDLQDALGRLIGEPVATWDIEAIDGKIEKVNGQCVLQDFYDSFLDDPNGMVLQSHSSSAAAPFSGDCSSLLDPKGRADVPAPTAEIRRKGSGTPLRLSPLEGNPRLPSPDLVPEMTATGELATLATSDELDGEAARLAEAPPLGWVPEEGSVLADLARGGRRGSTLSELPGAAIFSPGRKSPLPPLAATGAGARRPGTAKYTPKFEGARPGTRSPSPTRSRRLASPSRPLSRATLARSAPALPGAAAGAPPPPTAPGSPVPDSYVALHRRLLRAFLGADAARTGWVPVQTFREVLGREQGGPLLRDPAAFGDLMAGRGAVELEGRVEYMAFLDRLVPVLQRRQGGRATPPHDEFATSWPRGAIN